MRKHIDRKIDPPTVEQLRAAMLTETRKREETCLAEINAALKHYGCQLIGQTVITGDQVSTGVIVRALPQAQG